MYEEVKNKLINFKDFRERRFRVKYLSKLALRSCGLEDKNRILTLEELAEFAVAYESYNRIWRLVLKENPDLRGTDYSEEKDILEQKKMLSLGYETGYQNDIKQLSML